MRCRFCFEADARCPAPDTASLKKKLDSLRECGFSRVVFIGGEATLIKDLPEIVSHIRGLGMEPRITTNGLTLANEAYLAALLEAGLQHIEFSMHSHRPEDAAFLSGRKDTFGKQSAALHNIGRIAPRANPGFTVNTNTVLTNVNIPHIKDTISFFHSFPFVVASSLKFPTFEGRILRNTALSPRYGDLAALIDEIRKHSTRAAKGLILDNFPLCALPPRLMAHTVCFQDRNTILVGVNYEKRVFHDRFDSITEGKSSEKCRLCALKGVCTGFPAKYVEMAGDDDARPVPNLFSLPSTVRREVLSCHASLEKKTVWSAASGIAEAYKSGYRIIELRIGDCGIAPGKLADMLAEAEGYGATLILRGPAEIFADAKLADEAALGRKCLAVEAEFPRAAFTKKTEAAFKRSCLGVMRRARAGAPPLLVVPADARNAAAAEKFVRLAAELRARGVAFEQPGGGPLPDGYAAALKKAAETARDKYPSMEIEFRGFPLESLPDFHYLYRFDMRGSKEMVQE